MYIFLVVLVIQFLFYKHLPNQIVILLVQDFQAIVNFLQLVINHQKYIFIIELVRHVQ